eukprot:g2721.t1
MVHLQSANVFDSLFAETHTDALLVRCISLESLFETEATVHEYDDVLLKYKLVLPTGRGDRAKPKPRRLAVDLKRIISACALWGVLT